MSILIDNETRLLVQGLTGREGTFHAGRNRNYGTNVVAGVTPGKGGGEVDDVPVFDTVAEAVQETKANTSMIFVPARFAADAVLEAHDAGLDVIVAITEGIPAMDMARAVPYIRVGDHATTLVGPNCPGLISPGKANVGIIPGEICEPGPVGLVSRSGTLTYQIIHELTQRGIGQSTCVGIGGDPIPGSDFIDILAKFEGNGPGKGRRTGGCGHSCRPQPDGGRRARSGTPRGVSLAAKGRGVTRAPVGASAEWPARQARRRVRVARG